MAYSEPIAFSIVWTCYGTWLPGDQAGWTKKQMGSQEPKPLLARWCAEEMIETPVILTETERRLVQHTIVEVCEYRNWTLHIANARSNHVHAVVSASGHTGKNIRNTLKAWCTRRLKERQGVLLSGFEVKQLGFDSVRQRWWTESGFAKPLFNDLELESAIAYAGSAQSKGGSKGNHHRCGINYRPNNGDTNVREQKKLYVINGRVVFYATNRRVGAVYTGIDCADNSHATG